MTISERIKRFRKEKGLTQKELGDLVNKSSQVISNWERGYTTTINHEDITNLSKVLGKSIEVIIGTDYVPPDTSPKQPKDLVKFLNQAEVMFDGDTYKLNDDDRKKIRAALELAFWDAKERNKRKKQ